MKTDSQVHTNILQFRNGGSAAEIRPSERKVIKRDGTTVPFDLAHITRAIALAFYEVSHGTRENPYRKDALMAYGLDSETFGACQAIAANASEMLEIYYHKGQHPTVEQIQDAVEMAITLAKRFDVARSYIVYRANHAARRLKAHTDDGGMSAFIHATKYARYLPHLKRRETFEEGACRVRDQHLEFFAEKLMQVTPDHFDQKTRTLAGDNLALLESLVGGRTLYDIVNEAFAAVAQKKVLPSMRSMQFGGTAVLKNHARMFNCSFSNVDRLSFFREYFFLLLSGCGAGFSVQRHHVARLPALPGRAPEIELPVVHHHVADTIEGWSDALDALINSYTNGTKVEFDYSAIRPKGAPLKTSGGKAPGHLPLKKALDRIERILEGSVGRQLRPIEVYDINMYVAKAVLAGGVRRSATICLFSPDDEEMMNAKTGDWLQTNPQRSASNNSAVLSRSETSEPLFRKLYEAQKGFGEPGFYFCENPNAGCNPCAEISLLPVVNWELSEQELSTLFARGYQGELPGTCYQSGFQMCNLTTIAGAAVASAHDFLRACVEASVIGTLQAAYTDIPYLGPVTRLLNEHDALLGVSVCGFADNPEILCDPEVLAAGARLCRATNRVIATLIGIRPAARVTCVKPEGTASLLLQCASGISFHYAPRYFRRVTANRQDTLYRHFKTINPQMTETCVYNPNTDDKILFPVTAPARALLRRDFTGVKFLELVRLVQRAWVMNGSDDESRSPELNHNVSNTCTFKDSEARDVADYIWANRGYFTGISLLIDNGDKIYAQAPNTEVDPENPADVARWNSLDPVPVDYTRVVEETDETDLKAIAACVGNQCAVA